MAFFLPLKSPCLDETISIMDYQEFIQSLDQSIPPDLSNPLLLALWYDAKGDWSKAHNIAQDISGTMGSWMHAYLHRKEGDLSNAAYWYSRAARELPEYSLEMEWKELVKEIL
ncbi:MAG: hypothetical protein DHS20C17_07330 [Cyclobacteriaceae bacterium]|nr:MAG: hypothetical protein DHS20C17_07330 [Cyclobacteriaceae bacterium]